jgi:endonuclease I
MLKKTTLLFLFAIFIFVLVGCDQISTIDNTSTVELTTEEPTTEQPITEAPTTTEAQTTTEEPTTEEPMTEQPTTEEPTTTIPTTEEPTTTIPTTEKPTTTIPTTEEPTTTIPTTEEPTTTIPTTEEPTTQAPTTEEPTSDYYDDYVDLSTVHTMADGTDLIVSGVVYFLTQNGYYIKDDTGNLFIFTNQTPTVELGSRVVVDGSLTTYRQVKQIGQDHQLVEVNAYEQDISQGVHSFEYGITDLIPGDVYEITGEVRIEGQYDNAFLYDGNTLIAEIYYQSIARSIEAIKAYEGEIITVNLLYYAVGDEVERYAFQGSEAHIKVYVPDETQALANDVSLLPEDQVLYTSHDFGSGYYGSTYEIINVTGDASAYVSYQGSYINVTKPEAEIGDLTGLLTMQVSLGELQPVTVTIQITVKAIGSSNIDMPYYQSADGLSGETLLLALNAIINNGFNQMSYDDAKWVLEESDRDPNNPNNIILVYTRDSIKGAWDYPNWNREHTWPQSKLNTSGQKADMHNLKPSDPAENSRRGNLPFGYMTGSGVYEPHDEVKGDVARIVFYMATMYLDLNIESGILGDLEVLLEWHLNDPVDDFERNRNDVIFSYQGNRNPFIDYPFFAEEIWS